MKPDAKSQSAEREQPRLIRWRTLVEKLAEQLRVRTECCVQSNPTLLVILCIPGIPKNIAGSDRRLEPGIKYCRRFRETGSIRFMGIWRSGNGCLLLLRGCRLPGHK